MQECPRCHFQQPKDRFCANCGLDIEHFKPKPTPILNKIIQNPTLQVVFILALVSSCIGYIYWNQANKYNNSSLMMVETNIQQDNKSQNLESDTYNSKLKRSDKKSNEDLKIKNFKSQSNFENESLKPKNDNNEQVVVNNFKLPTRFSASFFEVTREVLTQIYQDSQILSESPQIQIISYNSTTEIEEIIKKSQRSLILPGKTETSVQGSGLNLRYLKNIDENNPDDLQGLFLDIKVSSITELGATIDLEGYFYLKGNSIDTSHHVSLDGNYTIALSSTLALIGIAPHRSATAKELQLFKSTPLAIMASQEFLNNETELLTLINFSK